MFASAASHRSPHPFVGAYHQVGVQTGVSTASAHQLVLMLFDGFLESTNEARGAIQAKKVDAKCRAISRALRIVDEGLRASLNIEQGGKLATDLNDLYTYIALRLTYANLHNDSDALAECARLIEPVRAAWIAIGNTQPTSTQ